MTWPVSGDRRRSWGRRWIEDVRSARRVLAVRLDNVGDVVLLAPALRALRAHLPDAHLGLLTSPAGAQVAPLLPWVDEVVVERVVWQDASRALPHDPHREQALISRLAAGRWDVAVVFTSWAQSPWPAAYAAYLAGIPLRAGESKEFGGGLLTHAAPVLPDDAHQVDRNLHLLATLGVPAAGTHLELRPGARHLEAAAGLLARQGVVPGDRYLVVAPGASCAARRYPVERFAALTSALVALGAAAVVVVGADPERELLGPVRRTAGTVDLVGQTSVAVLAAVLAGASLVVANDSGPMHVADALGVPQVVLYSGTELVSQWEPRTSPARLLHRPAPCSPCYRFECPVPGMPCLDVEPGEVLDAVRDLLLEAEVSR